MGLMQNSFAPRRKNILTDAIGKVLPIRQHEKAYRKANASYVRLQRPGQGACPGREGGRMWGRRRAAQAVQSAETGAEALAVSAAVSAALEQPIAAPDTVSGVVRHLEALSVPPAAAGAEVSSPSMDAPQTGTPANGITSPTIRANPLSTAFGDMVALLMKSPAHKHLSIADLEWLLLPPVALNQFLLADASLENGKTLLAGYVLWAKVSSHVNAQLLEGRNYPVRLSPQDWCSGDFLWIVDVVGDLRVVPDLIDRTAMDVFKGAEYSIVKPNVKTNTTQR